MIANRNPEIRAGWLPLAVFVSATLVHAGPPVFPTADPESYAPPSLPPPLAKPDLEKREERMIEAGVPPEVAQKVIELTKEVQKLQATPAPGSYRPEDLSTESRKQLQSLLDRGVPVERAVQMLLLQEKYGKTLKELSALPGVPRGEGDVPSPPNARLLATAPGLGEESFAIIEDGNDRTQRLYRSGARFRDYTLAAVQWGRVILQRGNRNEILEIVQTPWQGHFAEDPLEHEDEDWAEEPSSLAPLPAPPGFVPERDAIRPTSATEFTIERAEVDRAIANLNQLFTQIRAVPHFEEGRANGFRLFAIRRDSIFERMGLLNDDIVTAISGHPLYDPAAAMDLLKDLADDDRVTVEITRNRQPIRLVYAIKRGRS